MDGVLSYLYNNLFECKLCSNRFSSKAHLIEHEKKHTDEGADNPGEVQPENLIPQVQVKTEIESDDDDYIVTNSNKSLQTNHVAERQPGLFPSFPMFAGPQASGSSWQGSANAVENPFDKYTNKMKDVSDPRSMFTKKVKSKENLQLPDERYLGNAGSSFAMYLTWQKIAEQTANREQAGGIGDYGKIVTTMEETNDDDGDQIDETKTANGNELPKETIERVDNYVKEVLTKMGIKNKAEKESPTKKDKPPLEKPFKCDVCGHCFAQNYKLIRHYRVHTGERPYKCNLCDASFSQKSILDNHERLHTGEKPFRCELCNAVFSVKGYLIKHYRTHTGEKPFKCNMCDSVFSDRGNLSKHKKIHSGEKPYKCGSCTAAFSDRSTLTKHQRIHTSDKAFKCEFCNASFAMKSALTTHKKIHTTDEQHKCDVCQAEFSQRGYLIRHLRTHTGEKQYIPSFLMAKKDEASSIITRSAEMRDQFDEQEGSSSFINDDSEMGEIQYGEQEGNSSIAQDSEMEGTNCEERSENSAVVGQDTETEKSKCDKNEENTNMEDSEKCEKPMENLPVSTGTQDSQMVNTMCEIKEEDIKKEEGIVG